MKILFLLPVLGQPRHAKRIALLQERGMQITVAAFSRDYHAGRFPNADIHDLGRVAHGAYGRRLWRYLSSVRRIRKLLSDHDIVYTFGVDMTLLSMISAIGSRKRFVVEVGDLRRVQTDRGLTGRMWRFFEKAILRRAALIVATSGEMLEWYHRGQLKLGTRTCIIENKLDFRVESHSPPPSQSDSRLTIGYFGLLRCDWTIASLHAIAKRFPEKYDVLIAGFPIVDKTLLNKFTDLPNVSFLGEYKSPQDLRRLYTAVDLVWAAYPSPASRVQDPTWWKAQAVCRSNRFYESCAFGRPMVTVSGSADGAVSEKYGLGPVLSESDVSEIPVVFAQIDRESVTAYADNFRSLERSIFQHGDDVAELVDELTHAAHLD